MAGFLAAVMGKAHGRQMDTGTRKEWQRELQRGRSKSLNAHGNLAETTARGRKPLQILKRRSADERAINHALGARKTADVDLSR